MLVLVLVIKVFLVLSSAPVEGAKILAIFPFAGPSQYILVQPFLKTLAARGHEVTVISAFPQKEKIKNFHDIPALGVHQDYADFVKLIAIEHNKWQDLNYFNEFFKNVSLNVLRNAEVQQLLHSNKHFDLLIIEALQTDALYGFAQHFDMPIIGVSSFGSAPLIDELVGNPSPLSYVPLVTSALSDRMNFWQRLHNVAINTIEMLYNHLVGLPDQVKIYKQYFPQAKIDLMELRKNVALILLNQHFSLSFPRPYVPNMIEVGGFQIPYETKPLPADMAKFLNDSKNGVIYFSMGSNIKSKDFPKEKLQIFLNVFATLKENVMWKFEEPNLPGKPDNVYISKWFPQSDILAHPNIKLFITHGGLLSTIETLHYGKPVVAVPIFYDQFLNAERACKAGFGLSLDFNNLNKDELKSTIERVLTDVRFAQNALKISRIYHDQPMKPLETAIYWTEYVLRHKGAPHMRVAAQDLNFFQYHSIDTIAVLFGGLAVTVIIICILVYKLIKCLVGKQKTEDKIKRKLQ